MPGRGRLAGRWWGRWGGGRPDAWCCVSGDVLLWGEWFDGPRGLRFSTHRGGRGEDGDFLGANEPVVPQLCGGGVEAGADEVHD
jgi:hypothetical protein